MYAPIPAFPTVASFMATKQIKALAAVIGIPVGFGANLWKNRI
jgi:hypothetical protein